jgi:hypothetical protein
VHYKRIDALEAALWSRLAAGETLVEACEAVAASCSAEEQPAFAGKISSWFRAWAERGWVVDVVTPM